MDKRVYFVDIRVKTRLIMTVRRLDEFMTVRRLDEFMTVGRLDDFWKVRWGVMGDRKEGKRSPFLDPS